MCRVAPHVLARRARAARRAGGRQPAPRARADAILDRARNRSSHRRGQVIRLVDVPHGGQAPPAPRAAAAADPRRARARFAVWRARRASSRHLPCAAAHAPRAGRRVCSMLTRQSPAPTCAGQIRDAWDPGRWSSTRWHIATASARIASAPLGNACARSSGASEFAGGEDLRDGPARQRSPRDRHAPRRRAYPCGVATPSTSPDARTTRHVSATGHLRPRARALDRSPSPIHRTAPRVAAHLHEQSRRCRHAARRRTAT